MGSIETYQSQNRLISELYGYPSTNHGREIAGWGPIYLSPI